jgi:hypothetical protein
LFWPTVLEVSVHDWLSPFLWTCGKAAPGGNMVHLVARKQKREEE